MKSVRLDAVLEDRLKMAALASRKTESEIIRAAVARHVDEILGVTVYDQIKDLILAQDGPPHPPQPTDAEMAEEMSRDELMHRRVINPRS